jgi:phage tail sheath gpL-like
MPIRVPEIDISILPAYLKQQNVDQKVLFVGQMLTGTATPGTLVTSIGNANEQDALFGANSRLAGMIRAAKKINKVSRMDAIPLADYSRSPLSHIQSFVSDVGFTYNASDTEFTGARMQQKDLGGGSYAGDVISVPVFTAATVVSYTTFTATDDGTIRYIVDGKYWNGSAWAASSNSWATSCSGSDVTAHIATLTPTGTNITIKVVTDTGSTQMWVSTFTIAYYATVAASSASGIIAFSGVATEAGTLYVSIGSKINHRYEIDITTSETANSIGVALAAAVGADLKCPVTVVNTTGSVAITASNEGTEGNSIGLRVEGSVAGITTAITAMSGGATNPSLTNLFDVIGDKRYQTVVYPSSFDLSVLLDLLNNRWNVNNNILDGVGIITITDTFVNCKSACLAKNTQSLIILNDKSVNSTYYKGASLLELNDVQSAEFAAIRALRLTADADISQYVISTNGIRDNLGGAAIASLPYFNTPFYNLPVIDEGLEFTLDEMAQLKTAGGSILSNNISNNLIIAGEIVTTYKTDPASNSDVSFKYLEYVDTSSNIREYFYNNLRARFAQSRLTEGDVQPNRNMANASIIGAFMDGLYNDLSGSDFVLTQAGETAMRYFKNNRTITLDLANGKVTITMLVPIVTQLRKIVAAMQISFSTNS